ncbi:hypothetical protein [Halomonas denitrificans]|nr:hypothetical protein [Halomonas denitrificans]
MHDFVRRPWMLLALVLAGPIQAQEQAPTETVPAVSEPVTAPAPPPSPCTQESGPARDFDFWIGDWQVYRPGTDQRVGTNRIARREGGCLLLEEWTGASGGTGLSMNFHDPERDAWRQLWQSASALIELEGGLDAQGRMAMEGSIVYHANRQRFPFRGRWTPRADGTVLQEFWQQAPDGDWAPWFAGEYRPAD